MTDNTNMAEILHRDIESMQPETTRFSSRSLHWSGLRADYRVQPSSDLRSVSGFDEHLVVVFLRPLATCTQMWSGRAREGALIRGDASIVPSGTPNRWAWRGNAERCTFEFRRKLFG